MMNHLLKKLAVQTGLTYDAEKNAAYGFWRDFLFFLTPSDAGDTLTVRAWVTAENAESLEALKEFLREFAGRWVGDDEYPDGCVFAEFRERTDEYAVTDYMFRLAAFLAERGFVTKCEDCGTRETVVYSLGNGETSCRCAECRDAVVAVTKKLKLLVWRFLVYGGILILCIVSYFVWRKGGLDMSLVTFGILGLVLYWIRMKWEFRKMKLPVVMWEELIPPRK